MATTIHSIAYKVLMDTRELNAGAVATKREMAAGQKVVDAHKTSIQKLEDELRKLANLESKGAIGHEAYRKSVARLTADYNKAHTAVGKFRTGLAGIANMKNAVVGALSAMGASQAFRAVTDEVADMDRFVKLSRRYALDTADLVRISYAATKDTTLSNEQVGKALFELGKGIAEASAGSGDALKAFETLGLSLEEVTSASAMDRMTMIADAFKNIKDENAQLLVSSQLFGKSGQEMVDLLRLGGGDMKTLADEADRLGLTWDKMKNSQIEQTMDSITEMNKEWKAAVQEFSLQVLPVLISTTKELAWTFKAWRQAFSGELFSPNEYKQTGMAQNLPPEFIDARREFVKYKQRYTGESTMSVQEEQRVNQGVFLNEQIKILNDMLKEMRKANGIAEAEALTFDKSKRELN